MDPMIRRATPRDATDLAALIDMAGDGLPSYFWVEMAKGEQSPFEFGRSRCITTEGQFSYRNAHIAEVDGAVSGGLISYAINEPVDLSDIESMHEIARPVMRLEAQVTDHWYINVLAVYPEARRQGIGNRLLTQAEALGRTSGMRGMALIVASENRAAMSLYRQAGYGEMARLPLVGYPGYKHGGDWVLLTKPHS